MDEKGRIRAEQGENTRGTLGGKVLLLSARTAWTRWGFALAPIADAGAVGVLLFGLFRSLRLRKAESR